MWKNSPSFDTVVEHAERPHAREQVGRDVEAGREIIVVIFGDRQEGDASCLRRLDGGENVVGRQRDLLIARAAEGVEKARHAGRAALADIERDAQLVVRAAQRAAEKGAVRIGDLDLRVAGESPSTVR